MTGGGKPMLLLPWIHPLISRPPSFSCSSSSFSPQPYFLSRHSPCPPYHLPSSFSHARTFTRISFCLSDSAFGAGCNVTEQHSQKQNKKATPKKQRRRAGVQCE